MAVVAVDAPGLQDALDVAFIARPADVIDDFVMAVFFEGFANARGDHLDRFLPADALPFAFAALADALERIQDPVGIVDLIDRRGAFGAQPAAAGRMQRVALRTCGFRPSLCR